MHLKNPNIDNQPLMDSIFKVSMKSNGKVIDGKCKQNISKHKDLFKTKLYQFTVVRNIYKTRTFKKKFEYFKIQ